MEEAKPFVKWAGGKGQCLNELERYLPDDLDSGNYTYVEPFVGGGAMLFHILKNHKKIKRVIINDINQNLICCYKLIKDNPTLLKEELKSLEDTYLILNWEERKNRYYECRNKFNYEDLTNAERAALFIFLNRTCYNGLYRENSQGLFNVPVGKYVNPTIFNEPLLDADHQILNEFDVQILDAGDYSRIGRYLSRKSPNFVYLDPPYRPLNATSNFNEYSRNPFGDKQQIKLKLFVDRLNARGCKILESNSYSLDEDGVTYYFENLYRGYIFETIYVPRFINAHGEAREPQPEWLIKNY